MVNDTRVIRDFIYLDADSLKSLSSQLFEGVTAQVIQSVTDERTGMTPPDKTETSNEEVAIAALKTESKFLYDDLYNRLESTLGPAVVSIQQRHPEEFWQQVNGAFLVKVAGIALIDDYGRLLSLLEKFNMLGRDISYIALYASGEYDKQRQKIEADVKELAEKVKTTKDLTARALYKKQLEALQILDDPDKLIAHITATQGGMQQNDAFLAALKSLINFFHQDRYEISIALGEQGEKVVFRGVMDKQWLRVTPEYLRSIYGGTSISLPIVIVGQVTHSSVLNKDVVTDPAPEAEQEGDDLSMKDVSHNMFRIMNTLDHIMTDSNRQSEVLIRPLAIYREANIPKADSMDS